MGRPVKTADGQNLVRDKMNIRRRDLCSAAADLDGFRDMVEEIRLFAFRAGNGWPNYPVMPEDDPLSTDCLREVMQID